MTKKIAILRGINVGGKRKILMADLRSVCEGLGWTDVKTYIQSGNVLFMSDRSNAELEIELEKAIKAHFGFDVPVIIRTSQEMEGIVEHNPFVKDAEIAQLHLVFLKEVPMATQIEEALVHNFEPDQFHVAGQEVYLYCAGAYHKTKMSNNFFEKKLKVGATTRNWKTVLKLVELSKMC
ncbi:DUF1697 domain-containing protein [Persicobacter psychrovividus]|uniref:DUF1697 domain-containing protein n=1 Tax=Persicobacter psychrovividus TaxID=387638 RepID=A0ABM7VF29_9BACT|nr:hypothetical protein PEPS_18560 [Persicobacter psychrovividus]